jgi:hypothetical protein
LRMRLHGVACDSAPTILFLYEVKMGHIPTMPVEPCGAGEMDGFGPSAVRQHLGVAGAAMLHCRNLKPET